ncbi:MAG TPA: helix-turn-helix transcriptional regulator [Allocoleopsis sp.]
MAEVREPEKESPLKKRRDELGLTQRDVAIAINVSVQTISNWETGRFKEVRLTLPQVKALCRVLQWSIDGLPDDFRPED